MPIPTFLNLTVTHLLLNLTATRPLLVHMDIRRLRSRDMYPVPIMVVRLMERDNETENPILISNVRVTHAS